MKLALFLSGLLVGFVLCSRNRHSEPCKLVLDVDELASPSIHRRTVLLRPDPVPQGSPPTAH
jgi:hypothetical protein